MTAWAPQVFTPHPAHPRILFARVAARSAAFEPTSAAGGSPVLVGSAAGHDRARVALGARGELLERLGNVMAGREAEAVPELVGTFTELKRGGIPAVEPRPQPGEQPRADTRRLWVRGRTAGGAEVFVPAGSAFLHHRPPAGCDAAQSSGSTGIAAHPDAAAAIRHAAWEVLERDLIRRSWYGLADRPPGPVAAALPPPLAGFVRERGLTATVFALPAPARAACVVVCLHRPNGTGQAFGARCGPSDGAPALNSLVEKAAYEALMVRWSMGTEVARRAWQRWRGATPPASAVQHALWAYHRQDSLRLWGVRPGAGPGPGDAAGAAGATDPPGSPGPPAAPDAPDPLDVLSGHTGQDVVLVDTTSAPAREAGVRVVRVLAPGALPLPSGGGAGHPHPFG
ncbi:YcaO-like family protein [Streptomyces sp. NBC_00536]|uniref:YcaO-like family protein n=1 Tax=Streptomyces sp. NBC_00536 TaxID=2975769 RepID=UPI002E800F57|nr:YcaO-like family protein [Streptomyces sp. NBC_00536]WUC82436.1 YcaO-like family protein [Streptomyces sp. NBC_00536]